MSKRVKLKKNNKGIALVSVLIIITLTIVLTASLLTVAATSFKMRQVNQKSKGNFYSTEQVVDDVQMIVQNLAADKLDLLDTDSTAYLQAVKTALEVEGHTSAAIGSFLLKKVQELEPGKNVEVSLDPAETNPIEITTDKLTIKKVSVKYTNSKGYQDSITTDIVINAPKKGTTGNPSNSKGYSVMAGSGLTVRTKENDNVADGSDFIDQGKAGYFIQHGGIYVGRQIAGGVVSSTALNIIQGAVMDCTGNTLINGDVIVDKSVLKFSGGTGQTVTIKGDIYLKQGAHLVIDKNTKLECKNIIVEDPVDPSHTKKQVAGYNIPAYVSYGKYYSDTRINSINPQYKYTSHFPYYSDPVSGNYQEDQNFKTNNHLDNNTRTFRDVLKSDGSGTSQIMFIDGDKSYEMYYTGITDNRWKYKSNPADSTQETVVFDISPDDSRGIVFNKMLKAEQKKTVSYNVPSSTGVKTESQNVDPELYSVINCENVLALKSCVDTEGEDVDRLSQKPSPAMGSVYYFNSVSAVDDPTPGNDIDVIFTPQGTPTRQSSKNKMFNDNDSDAFPFAETETSAIKYIGSSQETMQFGNIPQDINTSDQLCLCIGARAYEVRFNSGNHFIGTFMSLEKVTYTIFEHVSQGYSLVNEARYKNDSDYRDKLNNYFDKLGNYSFISDPDTLGFLKNKNMITDAQWDKTGAFLVNSMIRGGIKSLLPDTSGGTTTPSTPSNDTSEENKKIDFIEMKDWSKE